MKIALCVLALTATSAVATEEKPRLKFVDPVHPCRKQNAPNLVSKIRQPL